MKPAWAVWLLVSIRAADASESSHKLLTCITVQAAEVTAGSVAGTGWDAIQEQVKKLEKKHALHIASYGEGNERRLTGKHETSSMESFRYHRLLSAGCVLMIMMVAVNTCACEDANIKRSDATPHPSLHA